MIGHQQGTGQRGPPQTKTTVFSGVMGDAIRVTINQHEAVLRIATLNKFKYTVFSREGGYADQLIEDDGVEICT